MSPPKNVKKTAAKTSSPALADQVDRDFITGDDADGLEHSLFVQAGAGAGKTRSIQHRVRNLLLESDLKPEHLAVITYTVRAAAELKDRIRSIMEDTAVSDPDPAMRTKAIHVLDELNKAKISTVHSFCLDLLKEYPVEFSIDPASQIADDMQSAALEREVVRELYLAEIESDPRFKTELEAWRSLRTDFPEGIEDGSLFMLFQQLYRNRELTPKKMLVPNLAAQLKASSAKANSLLSELCEDIFVGIENEIEDHEDSLYVKVDKIRSFFWDRGVTAEDRSEIATAAKDLLNGAKYPFPGKSSGNKSLYKNATWLADYKERVAELKETLEGYQVLALVAVYNLAIDIYPAYRKLYDDYKRKAGFLDFADCIILLRNGLRDEVILRNALQERFTCLIVDEFQDSDPLQSEILFYLAAEKVDPKKSWRDLKPTPGSLLFVGDPKQSIYGYNRADISIYLDVMNRITKADPKANRVLSTNFRSRGAIVDFVNKHFSQIIKTRKDAPLAAPSYEKMTPKNTDTNTEPGVVVLDLNLALATDVPDGPGIGKKGGISIDEKRLREPWLVGKFIKEQIAKHGKSPGDFLILFRAGTGMPSYESTFELMGIPVINTKTASFLKSPEVYPLLSLAGMMINPMDRYYLYGVLRSPFCGYTDAQIYEMISKTPKKAIDLSVYTDNGDFLKGLAEIAQGSEGLLAKFERACRHVQLYANGDVVNRDAFLAAALKLKEILRAELVVNEFNEGQTLQNLMGGALKKKMYRRGKSKPKAEMEEDKLLLQTSSPSKVQLMTIHGAKGLEAKCVILANPEADRIEDISVLIDREKEEIMPVAVPICGDILGNHPDLSDPMGREKIFKEEEEKRVLYVATTRAKDNLYLVRYKDTAPGTFFNPLAAILDPKLTSLELVIEESYRERFAPKARPAPVKATPFTEADLMALQADVCNKITKRTVSSEAVTTSLKAEALEVFKANPDARDRGMEIGKLMHEVMESICLRAGEGVATSEQEASLLLERSNNENYGFEPEQLKEMLAALVKFLSGALYKKIRAAELVLPESSFKVKGQVHGVVDLLYKDREGLHLVDWKTDVFSEPARAEKVKAFYKKQIEAYVVAITEGMNQKIATAECVYLF